MKRSFIDQMGRDVSIEWPPKRIISLVPSQTEFLYWLGLKEEVVGITKFCIHPEEWFRSKTRIGGTKKIDFIKIEALKPDLIIGNKEENEEVQVKHLIEQYPVWMSDIHNLEDAYDMMNGIGAIVNRTEKAQELVSEIKRSFEELNGLQHPARTVAYFIWKEPYMVAGQNTFLTDMLSKCDLRNVFMDCKDRYPTITKEEIKKQSPDIILLSSEPYPFSEKHIDEFQQICPKAKIALVDGEYFSWYGSRLLGAPAYFNKVLKEIE